MSQPRTVLYLHSSAGHYGADRQLQLIATGLDPERYRALVVLPGDGPLADALRSAGIEVQTTPLAVLRRAELAPAGLAHLGGRLAAGGLGLGQLARARRAALIHSNTSVVLSGALAARVARVPHVWHVREIYTGFERAWPVYRRLLLGAAALPCVSAATRAQFGDAPRARVVHDGLAIEADAVAPAALELPSGALICATLGRVSSWKGQDVLLRAIAAAEGTAAVIAGDAWPGQEQRERDLRALAERLGIAARVRFVRFLDDPRPLYAAADVVVVPSTNPDPLPNAALEGAACGRCVVASAHGGLLEIVRDGETGLLVAPADHEALAAALRRLAGDRDLVRRLGEAARSDVRARFAPAALLERLQALYDELVPPAADAMA